MRRLLPTLCAVLLALTACGSERTDPGTDPGTDPSGSGLSPTDPTPTDPSSAGPSETTSSGNPATVLTITLREVEGQNGEESAFSLTCDPVGGDLPSAATACDNLASPTVDPFAPVPRDRLCQDVIDGPGQITVTGNWEDAAIDAQFSQRNSCESERFYNILRVLDLAQPE